MWICITRLERFLRCRLCLVVFLVALAVISLTEAPIAKAEDIVKGENHVRNIDLYYAAVATVIPTAALVAELSQDGDDDEEWLEKMIKNSRSDLTTINLIDSIANANVAPDVGAHSKENDENSLQKSQKMSDVYRNDEVMQSVEGTKHRTNTQDHEKRTTHKSKEQLIAFEYEVQPDIKEFREEIVTQSASERTLPLQRQTVTSGVPEFVNTENNIYDFFEDFEDDEEEEIEAHLVRTRKDTAEIEGVTWQSLQRLAELVTASNPDLSLINLVTPNPDIEITIEVLSGADESDDQLVLANEVTQTKPGTKPGRKGGKGKKGRGKNKKDKDRTDNQNQDRNSEGGRTTNIPEHSSKEEETNKPVDNGEEDDSSYSFHIGGPLLPFIPDNFEDFNFPEDTFPMDENGAWSGWSRCTATCGGGRTERSRSCGFSCTSTETQDCNQHSCPKIEYLDSQIIAGIPPVETSSPTVQTTDELYRFLNPSLAEFETDSCAEWMSCKSEKLMSYLSRLEDLPSCPCLYPTTLQINDLIWDKTHKKMFRWITSSDNDKERLNIYKPTAHHCIRSLLETHSTSLAAQQCCYEESMKLITRGPGAGTPKLISREISPELNYKIDILPWLICKGDWSKYNSIRQPNNARGCRELPGDEAYQLYFDELKDF